MTGLFFDEVHYLLLVRDYILENGKVIGELGVWCVNRGTSCAMHTLPFTALAKSLLIAPMGGRVDVIKKSMVVYLVYFVAGHSKSR